MNSSASHNRGCGGTLGTPGGREARGSAHGHDRQGLARPDRVGGRRKARPTAATRHNRGDPEAHMGG
eukprot:7985174-Lingulodinium_polyedra.AAC.1